MTADDAPHPPADDDLRPSPEHEALVLAELIRIKRVLKVSVAATGIPPADHLIIVSDIRGVFGRQLGEAVVGEPLVEHRLRQALQRGIRPSISAPLPVAEATPILAMVGADAIERVMARPPGTIAVLVVDVDDNAALVFSAPLDGMGPS
ncbi:MAG: hypothetical protein V2A79_02605 [Planctomycetota bacterium]